MIRAGVVFLLVVAIVVSVLTFTGDPGQATVVWLGWRADTTASAAIVIALLAGLVTTVVWRTILWILDAPRRAARARAESRRRQANEVLARGFLAIAAGDGSEARRLAKKAADLAADSTSLVRVLNAQAAEAAGDIDQAKAAYAAMLSFPEMRLAGHKGLMQLALAQGQNETALRQESAPATALSAQEARLQTLLDSVLRNRFLPQPNPNSVFVGDGDFKAVGAEFLGHFIRMGGLQPQSCVLDIGCGIGRMAVPLTQYLDFEKGRYSGIDPVEGGIAWCRRFIASVYPNFAFQRVDIAHELYNPNGKISGKALKLPYADGHFDFVVMTSIVTHLPPDEVLVYLREVGRLLKPGGRLFMTAFVVDPIAAANETGRRDPRLSFARDGDGPCWYVPDLPRLAAVGFDDGFLDAALDRAGLAIVMKSFGSWRGQAANHYQDVFVAERREGGA